MNNTTNISLSLSQFTQHLIDNGYSHDVINAYVHKVEKFLLCHPETLKYMDENSFRGLIKEYTDSMPYNLTFSTIQAAIHAYYRYKTGNYYNFRRYLRDVKTDDKIEQEIARFIAYLENIASLSPSTITAQCSTIRHFLCSRFPHGAFVSGTAIRVDDVKSFLSDYLSHLKATSRKTITTRLRSYIRFLEYEDGFSADKIKKLPMAPRVWKLSNIPKCLTMEEINKLLSAYDMDSKTGIRDYAIVRCLSDLGLRCSEVAALTLDDILWALGIVRIYNTKTHSNRSLPLNTVTSTAIAHYICKARPNTQERSLFIRFNHENGMPMGVSQVRNTVRRAAVRAGLKDYNGTHMFRHTVAKDMFTSGTDIKTIADILGHKSIETTMIYTKINYPELEFVAGHWPEEVDV